MFDYKSGDYSNRLETVFLVIAVAIALMIVAALVVPEFAKSVPRGMTFPV